MKQIRAVFRYDIFFVGLQFILQAFFLYPYFHNKQILYGEAQFYTSWQLWLEKTGNAWMNIGLGQPAAQGIANHFPILYIFSFLESRGLPFNSIQYGWFLLLLFLPFIFMYLLIKRFTQLTPFQVFLFATAYVYNPIYLQQWVSVNPWLMGIYYVIPMYWFFLSISWKNNTATFFISNVMFFFSVYLFANPPYLVISALGIAAAFPFLSAEHRTKLFSKFTAIKLSLVFISFCLINNFVLINLFLNFQRSLSGYLTAVNPYEILSENSAFSPLVRVLSLKHMFSDNPDFTFLNGLVVGKQAAVLLFLPLILIFYTASVIKSTTKIKILYLYAAVTVFLVKALNPPFSFVFLYMFEKLPLFSMFKSAPEKFSPLYIFCIILTLALGFEHVNHFQKKIISYLLLIWIVFFQIPLITFNIIPNIKHLGVTLIHTISHPSFISNTIDYFNNQDKLATVLSLPGPVNYLTLMKIDKNKYYLGLDPIMNNIPQHTIEAYEGSITTKLIYESFRDNYAQNVLPLYDVKHIVLNKNVQSGFGLVNGMTANNYDKVLKSSMEEDKTIEPGIKIYSVPLSYGRIYIPVEVHSSHIMSELSSYLSNKTTVNNPYAFYYKTKTPPLPMLNTYPNLIFKRFSPTKYKVIIRNAYSHFPIVLNESFNPDWRLYPIDFTDNISSVNIFATWNRKYLSENSHYVANAYANSWNIDTEYICKDVSCDKNADGTYNLELLIEYWPQATVKVGILISVYVALLSFIYIAFYRSKNET